MIPKRNRNQKLIKKCPTVIIKANRKMLTKIFKSIEFFTYYILFIYNSNDSRYTSFLKKGRKKERNKKRKQKPVRSIILNINQRPIPV